MAPRITSLSHRTVAQGSGQSIYITGEEFTEITGVWFGEEWCRDYKVDGQTIITAAVPELAAGSYYVIVQSGDSTYSDTHDQCVIEIQASSDGPVAAELSLDSITPERIYVGQEATYWVKGTGMLGASAVMLGSSACTFQATDDQTLVITVPERVRDVTTGTDTPLWVYPKSGDALSLSVPTYGPEPVEEPALGFMVWAVTPDQLPTSGGTVTLEGDGLTVATRVLLGEVECTITEQSRGRLVASVPSLEGMEGQTLVATVVSSSAVASNASSVGVVVRG